MLSSDIIPGLPNSALLVAVTVTVVLPTLLTYLMMLYAAQRTQLKSRLAAIGGRAASGAPAASKLSRQVQVSLKEADRVGAKRRRVALKLRIEQAGLSASLRVFYGISAASAVAGTLIYLLLGYRPLFAPAVVAVMGFGLPRYTLRVLTIRRQRRFTQHFADAIDVIIRGIRSGLPVGECLNIIARESQPPVSEEFRMLVDSQRLGITQKQALENTCRRMPTPDMKFFAVVLNLQQQTGGNLAETLQGLSNVLRGRKKLADKIRAMSSEARMTATIIGALPFLVSFAIYLISPGYISLLWTDPMGKMMLYGGLTWMALGTYIMKQMVSFEA